MGDLIKVLNVEDDNRWNVFSGQIPDGDENQAEKSLKIITSVGQFGIGKSFLQNFLLGAMHKGESYFDDTTELFRIFPMETSLDSKTKGIDMLNEYLEYPPNEMEMVFSLWDTEGPSNPNHAQDHAMTVFALSAYFSQVLIYNVKEKLTSESMDKMQVFLDKIREKFDGKTPLKFKNLVIVIRDAVGYFGYNWEGGKAYMAKMEREGGGQSQTALFFKEIRETFNSVWLFMMPAPNDQVKYSSTTLQHMKDIGDEPFRKSLRTFTQKLLNEIVHEGVNDSKMLRVCDLKTQLTEIAERFQHGDEEIIHTLANAQKQKFIERTTRTCFGQYQRELLEKWGGLQYKEERTERNDELKRKTLENLKAAIEGRYVENRFIDAAMDNLERLLDERFKVYNDKAHKYQKAMWIIGGVIIIGATIALIIMFPAQPAVLGTALSHSIAKLLIKAMPQILKYLRGLIKKNKVKPTETTIEDMKVYVSTVGEPPVAPLQDDSAVE